VSLKSAVGQKIGRCYRQCTTSTCREKSTFIRIYGHSYDRSCTQWAPVYWQMQTIRWSRHASIAAKLRLVLVIGCIALLQRWQAKLVGKGILTPYRSKTPKSIITKNWTFWLRCELQHACQFLWELAQECLLHK